MNYVPCSQCKGDGYVKDMDVLADAEDTIKCSECKASGFIEKMPF